ncbi:Alpha-amlyase [Flavobacterium sp. 9AF]|uniref:alpha-amylase family glycosyl hydrolase n=1 Tax=Flavobacterium sp. 9AF TaxID=2653142 RepID=UPI0012F40FC0|nr:alpha-amylase family glycosyl hydrolase [Flavobacterium sp. 9AF]VXC26679.1 Alpha-amlyase [Flavobacterium sp. 9AF]
MKKTVLFLVITLLFTVNCKEKGKDTTNSESEKASLPFVWEAANVYFLLTDRFNNGDTSNDTILERNQPTGKLRGFEGGDIRGIIQKIDENYFTDLGINVIWMTPIVEQIHGCVDEGTGNTYAFHGYWTKDWTALDPNFGTKEDLAELVTKAHSKGIRIVLDAVINHTGPVTEKDPVYSNDWVRTSPKCTYDSYKNYINCTLVENLPDIKTESKENVALPQVLVDKWKKEGRYEAEMASLETFFKETGYPKAPKYYIMKWLSDYIINFGIDGYRVDTVKHTYEDVWSDFSKVCQTKFELYKKQNPTKILDNNPFFLVGEVYGYGVSNKKLYDFGDKKVDYFANGFNSLINFNFKGDANKTYEEIFSNYNTILQTDLKGYSVMNYISSHDDGYPFDKKRERCIEAGTKLLLTPGISQIYYGDETGRVLEIEGTIGDASLRSFMNWDDIKKNSKTKKILLHFQKLGQFRKKHPAIGAGKHNQITASPYVFSRTLSKNNFKDNIVIGLDLNTGKKEIVVGTSFKDGDTVLDTYSNTKSVIKNGKVSFDTPFTILLIEKE